ncbi:hypothetical protein, partial [Streptomyces sp. GC420]|uniref:hypothetical protein n=1 Tax=Streptomyces sp. GC420 TaxID=2697568 RepID=UPI001FB771C9
MRARVWVSWAVAWGFVLAGTGGFAGGGAAYAAGDGGFTIKDPRITESSGLAASRAHPGIYWTHNDSDDGAYIYAVDSGTGGTVARIALQGVGTARDVEAISIGPDGNIYVGDIGDNLDGSWEHVWIYRIPEPKTLADATVRATQFTVRYEDGPRNAEALMVHPKTGRVYIATKSEDGKGGIYEGPAELGAGDAGNTFTRVGDTNGLEVTDGAFSPDGTRLVLRGYFGGEEYFWADGRLGKEIGDPKVPVSFSHPQGESVTFTPDGRALMFGSEGADSPVERVELSGTYLPDSV